MRRPRLSAAGSASRTSSGAAPRSNGSASSPTHFRTSPRSSSVDDGRRPTPSATAPRRVRCRLAGRVRSVAQRACREQPGRACDARPPLGRPLHARAGRAPRSKLHRRPAAADRRHEPACTGRERSTDFLSPCSARARGARRRAAARRTRRRRGRRAAVATRAGRARARGEQRADRRRRGQSALPRATAALAARKRRAGGAADVGADLRPDRTAADRPREPARGAHRRPPTRRTAVAQAAAVLGRTFAPTVLGSRLRRGRCSSRT